MKIFGLVGRSGSGKTTLLVDVIAALRQRGLSVSTIKHAHHGFDIDRPGKDSYRHREAGAGEVLLVSGNRFALLHENRGEDEPPLEDLIALMAPVDILLVEGFHDHGHPMLEVYRPSVGKDPLWPVVTNIVAVASDETLADLTIPRFDLADTAAIVTFILDHAVPVRPSVPDFSPLRTAPRPALRPLSA